MDIRSGAAKHFDIPDGNSAWTNYGLIAMDFSPDGRYLVFSASSQVEGELVGPFLSVLDTENASFYTVNTDGKAAHPVWKGR